jgi:hypothetical protein
MRIQTHIMLTHLRPRTVIPMTHMHRLQHTVIPTTHMVTHMHQLRLRTRTATRTMRTARMVPHHIQLLHRLLRLSQHKLQLLALRPSRA